jgi:hypothetical protein
MKFHHNEVKALLFSAGEGKKEKKWSSRATKKIREENLRGEFHALS